MNNLAVINTKTNQVKVFSPKKVLLENIVFGRALDLEEIEDFRKDPKGFLAVAVTHEPITEDQLA